MSNSQTSMNISSSNVTGSCSFKCAFAFNYQESNGVTASNQGSGIKLNISYLASTSPVVYNDIKYNIVEAVIVSPSIHLFNGSTTDAELIIFHTPVNGSGQGLSIYIPIDTTGATSSASQILKNIIDAVSAGANASGQSTSQITDFTLNDIVPMAPFYTYTDSQNNNIVYGIKNAISISSDSIQTLQKCIIFGGSIPAGPTLFINNAGPSSSVNTGEIYIDCQPTGSSEEEENISTKKR